MRKYIVLSLITIFFLSCSTSKELTGVDPKIERDSLFKGHTTLIIKQRKEIEHYAKFSYYSNYTTLIDEVNKDLTAQGYKVIASQVPVFSTSSRDDIRALAGRYAADRVLLLSERYTKEGSVNVLALSYLTIIGMYFFPGNSMKAVCTLEAELLNPENGETIKLVSGIASSHKYVYRIGNSDSALYASYLESMKRSKEILISNFGKPVATKGAK